MAAVPTAECAPHSRGCASFAGKPDIRSLSSVRRSSSATPPSIKVTMSFETDRPRRLAVLIDADNASPRIAAGLFEEIATVGEASVRRIYGDFSGTRLKGWSDILSTYAIMPHQNFANTVGKTRPILRWSSTPWTFCILAGSTGFAWYRPTAILRDWPLASGNRVWTFLALESRKPRKSFGRRASASSIPRT